MKRSEKINKNREENVRREREKRTWEENVGREREKREREERARRESEKRESEKREREESTRRERRWECRRGEAYITSQVVDKPYVYLKVLVQLDLLSLCRYMLLYC
jgi:hypothetical protein